MSMRICHKIWRCPFTYSSTSTRLGKLSRSHRRKGFWPHSIPHILPNFSTVKKEGKSQVWSSNRRFFGFKKGKVYSSYWALPRKGFCLIPLGCWFHKSLKTSKFWSRSLPMEKWTKKQEFSYWLWPAALPGLQPQNKVALAFRNERRELTCLGDSYMAHFRIFADGFARQNNNMRGRTQFFRLTLLLLRQVPWCPLLWVGLFPLFWAWPQLVGS